MRTVDANDSSRRPRSATIAYHFEYETEMDSVACVCDCGEARAAASLFAIVHAYLTISQQALPLSLPCLTTTDACDLRPANACEPTPRNLKI